MSKKPQTPLEIKYQILLKLKEGVSIKSLARNNNVSTQTIRNWEKKSHSGSLIRKEGSGGKSLLNSEDFKKVEEIFDSNRDKSSRKLVQIIKNQMGITLSIRTIRNYRKKFNWIPVRPITIPKISENALGIL